MKTTSIRELSQLAPEAAGETVILSERRGEPVAQLRPTPPMPEMSELWQRFPSVARDSGRFLEEDR